MSTSPDPVSLICSQLGEEPIRALVREFYRLVPADPLLGPLYPPQDLAGAEQRLADFLIYRLGGSDAYLTSRGHPKLRMRHAGFAITPDRRDRWMQLMRRALDASNFPADARVVLEPFLDQSATFLVNAGPSSDTP